MTQKTIHFVQRFDFNGFTTIMNLITDFFKNQVFLK